MGKYWVGISGTGIRNIDRRVGVGVVRPCQVAESMGQQNDYFKICLSAMNKCWGNETDTKKI
jgi:hypothetical protein